MALWDIVHAIIDNESITIMSGFSNFELFVLKSSIIEDKAIISDSIVNTEYILKRDIQSSKALSVDVESKPVSTCDSKAAVFEEFR